MSSFQTCQQGDDSVCSQWFGDTAVDGDYCCWKFTFVDVPTTYTSEQAKQKAEATLQTFKSFGLASQKGETSWVCMNGWSQQYPDGEAPPNYTWKDSSTELTTMAYCDGAVKFGLGIVSAAAAILASSY